MSLVSPLLPENLKVNLGYEEKSLKRIVLGVKIPDVLNYSNPHAEVIGSFK